METAAFKSAVLTLCLCMVGSRSDERTILILGEKVENPDIRDNIDINTRTACRQYPEGKQPDFAAKATEHILTVHHSARVGGKSVEESMRSICDRLESALITSR